MKSVRYRRRIRAPIGSILSSMNSPKQMRIAFLGLGLMGRAVARHILQQGHAITVWNRTASAAEPLAALGAEVAATPADATRDAEVVFTMLHDDAAVESVLFEQGSLKAMPADAIHVSLSTISVKLAKQLQTKHADRQHHMIGCPVFGRPAIAEEGKLWLAIAGPDAAIERVSALLDTFSRGRSVVGESPYLAHALKLGGNFLITAMIASLSEALTYAEGNALAPEAFLETVNAALFQSSFYANYGKVMLHPPDEAAATVTLGEKDTRLFQQAAAEAGVATPLADGFHKQLEATIAAGAGDADWAAGYYRQVREQSRAGMKGMETK
jgi:3-hydroxyisobutyrate dehydrogenase-like beta-hydroxyacid dehydrogenase